VEFSVVGSLALGCFPLFIDLFEGSVSIEKQNIYSFVESRSVE